MDWKTFFSNMIDSLSWPIAVIILVLLLREPLHRIILLIKRVKYKDLEMEFEQSLDKAEESIPIESQPSSETLTKASLSPRDLILSSWLDLEAAAIETLEKNKVPLADRGKRSPAYLHNKLKEVIHDHEHIAIFNDLRVLRNKAVHEYDFDVSRESALRYAKLASYLKNRINVSVK